MSPGKRNVGSASLLPRNRREYICKCNLAVAAFANYVSNPPGDPSLESNSLLLFKLFKPGLEFIV